MADLVWFGAPALTDFLVSLDELEPFPGNPRRGDLPRIRESLRRFGQAKPILVDGSTIVAGRHVALAAQQEGWTHIAVTQGSFADDHEARAYMLADNRSHDTGGYEEAELVEHLAALHELDRLDGTGYDLHDLEDLQERLRRLEDGDRPRQARKPKDVVELRLAWPRDRYEQLETWLQMIGHETGIADTSDQVYEAARRAARELNQ